MSTPSRYEEDSDSDNPLYLWSRSQTPEENFNGAEGADEHGNWPLSIVSEEVGHDNEVRCVVSSFVQVYYIDFLVCTGTR